MLMKESHHRNEPEKKFVIVFEVISTFCYGIIRNTFLYTFLSRLEALNSEHTYVEDIMGMFPSFQIQVAG